MDELNATYFHTDYYSPEHSYIDALEADELAITMEVDFACLFGGQCARGGGAEVHDARTFVRVDTYPIADAGEYLALGIVAAVALHGLLGLLRDRMRTRA